MTAIYWQSHNFHYLPIDTKHFRGVNISTQHMCIENVKSRDEVFNGQVKCVC
jgi:hypothetical protein